MVSSGSEQVRHPGGAPNSAGGQYATATRRESQVRLHHLSDDQYNADGSFDYPPVPRSAAQHVKFWTQVKIPDAVITRIRIAYAARWDQWATDQMEAWAAADPEPVRARLQSHDSHLRERDAWKARFDMKYNALIEERDKEIPVIAARGVIRAAQMSHYAQYLPTQEDYDEVHAHEMNVGEAGSPLTVAELRDMFRLHELPAVTFEDPSTVAGLNQIASTDLLSELVELHRRQGMG